MNDIIQGQDISTICLEYNDLVVYTKNGDKYYLPLAIVVIALKNHDYSIKLKRTRTYITDVL